MKFSSCLIRRAAGSARPTAAASAPCSTSRGSGFPCTARTTRSPTWWMSSTASAPSPVRSHACILHAQRSSLHTPHVPPSLLHSSTPLSYRFITVVGVLVQGSLVYTKGVPHPVTTWVSGASACVAKPIWTTSWCCVLNTPSKPCGAEADL